MGRRLLPDELEKESYRLIRGNTTTDFASSVEVVIGLPYDLTVAPGRDKKSHSTVGISERQKVSFEVSTFGVEVVDGADSGAKKVCRSGSLTIGSGPSVDLKLQDPAVSRFHCEIEVIDGRIRISDHGSKNGTWVGRTLIERAFLVEDATIHIGRTELRFHLLEGKADVPISHDVRFGDLVAVSPSMRRIFSDLARVAPSEASVLIEGETGCGKDLAAEAIHRASGRRDGPFVIVDCASLPAQLIESQLFGHVAGAFTGADEGRRGAFATASGGTLLLDEIGELPIDLQPKLLRVLESQRVTPVGGNQAFPVDIRVIAATNRNLWREVNERRFRDDLYYRLAVMHFRIPPLRERTADLPILIEELLAQLGQSHAPAADYLLSEDGLKALERHHWPGNVRELRNYVERYLILGDAAPIGDPETSHPPPVGTELPLHQARSRWLTSFERRYLEAVLEQYDGNISAASRHAGINRVTFYRLLSKTGLRE